MILMDTSVWISFFKGEEKARKVKEYILEDVIVVHPFVYGELILGGLSDSSGDLLKSLPFCNITDISLIYDFIRRNNMSGSGIGLVDVSLMTSAIIEKHSIFTFDEKLQKACATLNISH